MTALRMANLSRLNDSDLQNLLAPWETLTRKSGMIKFQKSFQSVSQPSSCSEKDLTAHFPTDRFAEFSKMTSSSESAAILAVVNVPSDQLTDKFQSFRSMFNSWGYQVSEDTELASAYLSISDLAPDEVNTKLTIIVDALKNYLEYPLVASAILASISTLEANETLDLMQKAYSLLGTYANRPVSP